MNLISYRKIAKINRLTLDKLNRHIKQEISLINRSVKIYHESSEIKASKLIHRQHNKIAGLILFPGTWQKTAFILEETISIFDIPYVTVSLGEKVKILCGIKNIENKNLLIGCSQAIKTLHSSL